MREASFNRIRVVKYLVWTFSAAYAVQLFAARIWNGGNRMAGQLVIAAMMFVPALGVLLSGGMKAKEFVGYVISQCIGALAGSGILALIFSTGGVKDMTGGFGSNGLGGVGGSAIAGLVVEIVLTFIFVIAILGVTSKKANHGSFGGLVIGLTLVVVHILGIGLTGTSVNPARSFGPAVFAAFSGNLAPLGCLWVFIVGPFLGAALAAFTYNFLQSK